MSELYRIKFRSEHFEVELEATDKDFISGNMMRLIEMSTHAATAPRLLQASSKTEEADAPATEAPAAEQAAPVEAVVEDAEVEPETPVATPAPKKRGRKRGTRKKSAGKKAAAKTSKKKAPKETGGKGFDPSAVASEVKASPHFSFIKEKILDKSNQINRILVSFYFAQDIVDGKGLTTGDVESITEALGNTIKSTNISSQLKKYDDLFITKGERKRGSVVHYKLNAKGKKQLEDLLSSAG